jgi:hypothetical protein
VSSVKRSEETRDRGVKKNRRSVAVFRGSAAGFALSVSLVGNYRQTAKRISQEFYSPRVLRLALPAVK